MPTAGEIVYSIPTDGSSLPEGPQPINFVPCVNVAHYGAKGDGVTDDTTAIEEAFAVTQARTSPYAAGIAPLSWNSVGSPSLWFPPGDYLYRGTGLTFDSSTDSGVVGMQAAPGSVRIRLNDGVYFLTSSGKINALCIEGIEFYGGAGAIRSTYTLANVTDHMRVQQCRFINYSVCAIGHLSSDFPYWHIRDCFFNGKVGASCVGVALSGLHDQSEIVGCSFVLNKYGLKIESTPSLRVVNCDFLRFSTTSPCGTADVWIVPRASPDFTNNGDACLFSANKFGNENLLGGHLRVLIADQGTGTNFLDKAHSTSASSGTVNNLVFQDNAFVGNDAWVAGGTASYLTSYCGTIEGVTLADVYQGNRANYIIWYGVDPATNALNQNNVIWLEHGENSGIVPEPMLSNYPGQGIIHDVNQRYVGKADTIGLYGAGDRGAKILRGPIPAADTLSAATETATTGPEGVGTNARILSFSSSSGYALYTGLASTAGRSLWAEVDLKVAASNPLAFVKLEVLGATTSPMISRVVDCPAAWQTVRLLLSPTETTARVRISPYGYAAGTTDVLVANVRLYHAASAHPINPGTREINAIDFGADPTGTADCAAAIQAAINLAATGTVLNGPRGGDVLLPAGSYRVNSKIILKDGTRLRGSAKNATVIFSYVADDDLLYYDVDTTASNVAKPVQVENLSIVGKVASTGAYIRLTGSAQASHPILRNLYVFGASLGTYGIHFDNTINLLIEAVEVQGMVSHGFFGEATNNSGTLRGTYALFCGGDGYRITGTAMALEHTASDNNVGNGYYLTLTGGKLDTGECEYAGEDLVYLKDCTAVTVFGGSAFLGGTLVTDGTSQTTSNGITIDGGTLIVLLNLNIGTDGTATGYTLRLLNTPNGIVWIGGYENAFLSGAWSGTTNVTRFAYNGQIITPSSITSNGGLQTFGANDSAGAGFRLVRVPNA